MGNDTLKMASPVRGTLGRNWLGFLFLLIALIWWGWWASRGWETVGMVGHEFRQAQTALSIRAMQLDGFSLDYPTPILGKPWSIPMEFPLYQYAVVKYCELFDVSVTEGGRWVAAWCFLIGLPALVLLLREAKFSWGACALGVIPVVTAPVYLFFSRTVMIESMAWAASAWFLVGVLKYRRSGALTGLGLALGAGAIAVLVKSTTWAVFCLPWAVLFIRDLWQVVRKKSTGSSWRQLVMQAGGIGVPLLLLGFAWVQTADSIKGENPLAHFLVSSELMGFNFGSLETRLAAVNREMLLHRWSQALLPWWVILPAFGVALVFRKSRSIALLGAAGFFGIQMIFFGLYLVHDYYFYANGAMVGVTIGALAAVGWDNGRRWFASALPALALVVAVGALQFNLYQKYQYEYQSSPSHGVSALSKAMQEIVDQDEVVVAHSPDWNSSLAFYADRKMMMIPDAQMYLHSDLVQKGVDLLKDESTPLLLMMRESRVHGDWLADRIDDLGLWPAPLFTTNTNVTAYARIDRYPAMRRKLQALNQGGIMLTPPFPQTAGEDKMQTAGTEMAEKMAAIGLNPTAVVFPYGFGINRDSRGPFLGTHAPTELYFQIPEGATSVKIVFGVNPDSLAQKDFDGVGMQLELVSPEGVATPFYQTWISPNSSDDQREVSVDLPPSSARELLYRVTGGPRDSYAFDQAWLRSLEFGSGE